MNPMKLRQFGTSNPCPFVVVSCYTPEYRGVFDRYLGNSLARVAGWGEPLYADCSMVFEVPSTGHWLTNCLLKPTVIAKARELTDKPIVWVDADATIPDIDAVNVALRKQTDAGPFDFAAYAPGIAKSNDHDSRVNSNLMSGTLVFMPTERGDHLLEDWKNAARLYARAQARGLDAYDQEVLFRTLQRHRADCGLVFRNLNPCWVKVHDYFPTVTHPLVVHHQASRTMKDAIR